MWKWDPAEHLNKGGIKIILLKVTVATIYKEFTNSPVCVQSFIYWNIISACGVCYSSNEPQQILSPNTYILVWLWNWSCDLFWSI